MDPETKNKLTELEAKIDAIYSSVEKTRKYFLTIIWITVIAIVLPIIGLFFAIPSFLSSYGSLSGLGL
ncbi:MAG: hypothetical protein KBC44_01635 [Candidatus Pacebacteria bacterium]|nr:hypothetical protein [Candidatus Paceibacterota bacterium]MBP9839665.1 hypothetical protein [Candidatus Paceibacterota bacterium]MDQ5922715.1 hypothetical protein [Patescibacteria group bacterium]